jgi:hypothetical protein
VVDDNREREVPMIDVSHVYADRILGRRAIYLDTNVWIQLSHERTEDAQKCLAACKAAQRAGAVVFPLSYAAISELIEQASSPSQMKRCELMDELSVGVSFRHSQAIREIEAQNGLRVLLGEVPVPVDRTTSFSYVVEAFGHASLSFTPDWTEEMIAQFMEHCWSTGFVTTIKWHLQHSNLDAWRREHIESERATQLRFEQSLSASIDHYKTRNGKPDYSAAVRDGHRYYFESAVLPLIAAIATAEEFQRITGLIRNIAHGNDDELLAQVLEAVPSVDAQCRMLAHRIMNPTRPYKAEDFWDVEHAVIPCIYSDAFCTLDGGLRHALRTPDVLNNSRCKILAGLDHLREYVERAVALNHSAGIGDGSRCITEWERIRSV